MSPSAARMPNSWERRGDDRATMPKMPNAESSSAKHAEQREQPHREARSAIDAFTTSSIDLTSETGMRGSSPRTIARTGAASDMDRPPF